MSTASVLQPRSPLRPFAMPFAELGSFSVDRGHGLVDSCEVGRFGYRVRIVPVVAPYHGTSRHNATSIPKQHSVSNGRHLREIRNLENPERSQNRIVRPGPC